MCHATCHIFFMWILWKFLPWKSSSVIHSFVTMSSINTLIHGELSSWPDLVTFGWFFLRVLIPRRDEVVSFMMRETTQGRTILSAHPHQLPPCPCVVCYQNAFFFFFWLLTHSPIWCISIMSFRLLRKMSHGFSWLVALFRKPSLATYK